MAWNDLTIHQRSQLMNMFRRNGVSSLAEMRRLYDLSSPLVETPQSTLNNAAPVYADGGYVPSDSIKDYLKKTEDFRSNWYNDGNGIPTVGYGFTGRKVKELYPNGMTRAQADAYFDDLVTQSAARMSQLTPNIDRLSQNQKDALFSYFYNIGEGNYSKGSPNMQKALREFDLDTVLQNIDAGYNDTKNPGLRKRRDYERALFQSDMQLPVQQEQSIMNNGFMYDNPDTRLPMVRTPYLKGLWSLENPYMYVPEEEIFASGGKIHIKKKNRGKFNALKRRTGKTTEELTHSKNPLTRKRAIFAQNAAKWRKGKKKSYGGIIF